MSTLVSVFSVRFNAGEVYGFEHHDPETIMGLTATVIQGMSNRGLQTIAVGMSDDGSITLVYERAETAGKALEALGALIQVLAGERRTFDEGKPPGIDWANH